MIDKSPKQVIGADPHAVRAGRRRPSWRRTSRAVRECEQCVAFAENGRVSLIGRQQHRQGITTIAKPAAKSMSTIAMGTQCSCDSCCLSIPPERIRSRLSLSSFVNVSSAFEEAHNATMRDNTTSFAPIFRQGHWTRAAACRIWIEGEVFQGYPTIRFAISPV